MHSVQNVLQFPKFSVLNVTREGRCQDNKKQFCAKLYTRAVVYIYLLYRDARICIANIYLKKSRYRTIKYFVTGVVLISIFIHELVPRARLYKCMYQKNI